MKSYLKLMRLHHYLKNLLLFVPLLCSGQFFELHRFLSGCVAFIAFSMITSVVYIFNDIKDKENDMNHPVKCNRPIAAGEVSVKGALCLAAALFIIAFLCNLVVFNSLSTILLVFYLLINISYSFGLKTIPILDVAILVSGFLLRILYGTIVTNIVISNWLYLTVITLAFYFSLGKRRNELKNIKTAETRKVLNKYTISFLDRNMYMCLTLANVFYALWSMDKNTINLYNTNYLIFTVPVVLIITMRYSFLIEGESDGDPIEVLIQDKTLLCLCTAYVFLMFAILYT